jgi:hypothetical protein
LRSLAVTASWHDVGMADDEYDDQDRPVAPAFKCRLR